MGRWKVKHPGMGEAKEAGSQVVEAGAGNQDGVGPCVVDGK